MRALFACVLTGSLWLPACTTPPADAPAPVAHRAVGAWVYDTSRLREFAAQNADRPGTLGMTAEQRSDYISTQVAELTASGYVLEIRADGTYTATQSHSQAPSKPGRWEPYRDYVILYEPFEETIDGKTQTIGMMHALYNLDQPTATINIMGHHVCGYPLRRR